MRIGGHVAPGDPIGAAEAEGADCVQIFLGNPQSWKPPKPRDDAHVLRASPVPIYVHAPYLVNVASPNNRVRIPSRKILQQTCDAAAGIGAAAVVVHGGHVTDDDDPHDGFERWRKALERLETEVPVYLENTAGGDHASHSARDQRIGTRRGASDVGARLEVDVDGRTARVVAGLGQRHRLCVGLPRRAVSAAADHAAVANDQTADERVG